MELSWLRTFVTVVEQENFRKAADVLYISQPSVSVHIKQLEKEVGVTLLERSNKKVMLTEEGRKYIKTARNILTMYQEGLEELHSFTQGYRSKLSIAISPLIADTILPYVLKQYLKEHIDIEVSVVILESKDIEQAVLEGEVDVGLSRVPSFHPSLMCDTIYEDDVILVAPHDGHDDESALPLDAEDLFDKYRLLTHNHPLYWDSLIKQLKIKFPKLQTMKVSQTHITKRFIEEGLGISFIPRSAVRRELYEGRLLEVYTPSIDLPKTSTYAIIKHNHTLETDFLAFLAKHRYN
ncbi:LysR family transcriptional regulator [Metabacillus iocasae]|uniref:LysR family transcriptional repressor of citA n=1 Tax=Priestia iocasae TaxID=2291674 RepID=A0ABS2QWP9_9BACI|nr:LysR family transcriptional regulator [Metabacillus iocasae]MBM7703904.1 LysR family transcriptional repressor of citA [Metabacillus iocasae]